MRGVFGMSSALLEKIIAEICNKLHGIHESKARRQKHSLLHNSNLRALSACAKSDVRSKKVHSMWVLTLENHIFFVFCHFLDDFRKAKNEDSLLAPFFRNFFSNKKYSKIKRHNKLKYLINIDRFCSGVRSFFIRIAPFPSPKDGDGYRDKHKDGNGSIKQRRPPRRIR